jgi:tetratricopeptide (TPR) repeat protein
MRKIVVTLLVSLIVTTGIYAQKSKRTSAYNYNKEFDNKIEMYKLKKDQKSLEEAKAALKLAKENIEPTITHEKTMNDPKTWLYRGIIYYNDARLPIDLDTLGKINMESAMTSFESLKKAKEIDAKKRYETDIDLYLQNLYNLFFSQGATSFNNKDYALAKSELKSAFLVQQLKGTFDTTAAFYVGLVSFMDKDADNTIDYMKKCDEVSFKDPRIYIYWNRALKMKGDTTAAIQVIQKARVKYPEELQILLEEAQIYLEKGENEKLKTSLLQAVKKDTDNANLWFLLGKTYDDDGEKVKAEEYYTKAIEANPDFFEAYYNIGAIYNNKASELMKEANDLPLEESAKYDKLILEANGYLEKAVPWLEKALKIKPDDTYTLHALKEAYTKLKQYDKAKALGI